MLVEDGVAAPPPPPPPEMAVASDEDSDDALADLSFLSFLLEDLGSTGFSTWTLDGWMDGWMDG